MPASGEPGRKSWFGQWHKSSGIFSGFSSQPKVLLPAPEMGLLERETMTSQPRPLDLGLAGEAGDQQFPAQPLNHTLRPAAL